jgi:hypothetical protein
MKAQLPKGVKIAFTFPGGWKRRHKNGTTEDYSGRTFDHTDVAYLDYLMGTLKPYRVAYGREWPVDLYWNLVAYAEERSDRFSLAESDLSDVHKDDRAREATLGDVLGWRKRQSPDWDDSDYDPSLDAGEELRDHVRRDRYGHVHKVRRYELTANARYISGAKRKEDDDPSVFVTVGLREDCTRENARYAALEGAMGRNEPGEDWEPPLSVRWIVLRNLEARGVRVYRFKPGKRHKGACHVFWVCGQVREFVGSEFRPVPGSWANDQAFIRQDHWGWFLRKYNQLRSLDQVLSEERWPMIHKDPRQCYALINRVLLEIEKELVHLEIDEACREFLGVACDEVREKLAETLDPNKEPEFDMDTFLTKLLDEMMGMSAKQIKRLAAMKRPSTPAY